MGCTGFCRRAASVWLLAVALQLVFVDDAAAYLEPGSVQFFFQMLVGALIGAVVTLRLYWRRIVGRLRGLRASRANHDDAERSSPDS